MCACDSPCPLTLRDANVAVWPCVVQLKRVMKEPEIRAVFNANKLPLKKAFDARSNAKVSATKAPTMTLESLLGAMNERKVAKDIIVDPRPAISGYYTPTVHSNLSQLDIRGAFVTAQGSGAGTGTNTQSGGVVVDYEEFLNILGLCGSIKYVISPNQPSLALISPH